MLKKPKLYVLDGAVWVWLCVERSNGTSVSDPIIKENTAILEKRKRKGNTSVQMKDGFTDGNNSMVSVKLYSWRKSLS